MVARLCETLEIPGQRLGMLLLITFLVGRPQLLAKKAEFQMEHKEQIVARCAAAARRHREFGSTHRGG